MSSDELVQCGKKAGDYLGMPDAHQNFLYDFASKYWGAVDQDGSGKAFLDQFVFLLNTCLTES